MHRSDTFGRNVLLLFFPKKNQLFLFIVLLKAYIKCIDQLSSMQKKLAHFYMLLRKKEKIWKIIKMGKKNLDTLVG